MTPTHKELVEALREAQRVLNANRELHEKVHWCCNCVDEEGLTLCDEALSKINPILAKLEAPCPENP